MPVICSLSIDAGCCCIGLHMRRLRVARAVSMPALVTAAVTGCMETECLHHQSSDDRPPSAQCHNNARLCTRHADTHSQLVDTFSKHTHTLSVCDIHAFLLLFVSFCCMRLYLMLTAVSYQMFFHVPPLGFLK